MMCLYIYIVFIIYTNHINGDHRNEIPQAQQVFGRAPGTKIFLNIKLNFKIGLNRLV